MHFLRVAEPAEEPAGTRVNSLRALSARVMSLVNLLQPLLHDVRVDLRRGNIAVTEHELDGA
jgi:hypothetical protein